MLIKKRPALRPRSRRWRFARARAVLSSAVFVLLAAGIGLAAYFQSFETDTAGWTDANRVMTGTHGVLSNTGAFHAEDTGGNAYTFWGGPSRSFSGGYTTTVDIYLDISAPYMNGTGYPNDTRFDWTSAIGTPNCDHRRDFVFNAGYYDDADATGAGPRFVISASNNAGAGSSFPKNPGRMPITIYDASAHTLFGEVVTRHSGPELVMLTAPVG